MRATAERRARIARVRQVQHLAAAGVAAAAEGKVVQLEDNAARLAALRRSLAMDAGATSGAALGARGELGTRLDAVRHGLADTLATARAQAVARVAERLDAHIAREGAERLETRAVAELQRIVEERMSASIRHRARESGRG